VHVQTLQSFHKKNDNLNLEQDLQEVGQLASQVKALHERVILFESSPTSGPAASSSSPPPPSLPAPLSGRRASFSSVPPLPAVPKRPTSSESFALPEPRRTDSRSQEVQVDETTHEIMAERNNVKRLSQELDSLHIELLRAKGSTAHERALAEGAAADAQQEATSLRAELNDARFECDRLRVHLEKLENELSVHTEATKHLADQSDALGAYFQTLKDLASFVNVTSEDERDLDASNLPTDAAGLENVWHVVSSELQGLVPAWQSARGVVNEWIAQLEKNTDLIAQGPPMPQISQLKRLEHRAMYLTRKLLLVSSQLEIARSEARSAEGGGMKSELDKELAEHDSLCKGINVTLKEKLTELLGINQRLQEEPLLAETRSDLEAQIAALVNVLHNIDTLSSMSEDEVQKRKLELLEAREKMRTKPAGLDAPVDQTGKDLYGQLRQQSNAVREVQDLLVRKEAAVASKMRSLRKWETGLLKYASECQRLNSTMPALTDALQSSVSLKQAGTVLSATIVAKCDEVVQAHNSRASTPVMAMRPSAPTETMTMMMPASAMTEMQIKYEKLLKEVRAQVQLLHKEVVAERGHGAARLQEALEAQSTQARDHINLSQRIEQGFKSIRPLRQEQLSKIGEQTLAKFGVAAAHTGGPYIHPALEVGADMGRRISADDVARLAEIAAAWTLQHGLVSGKGLSHGISPAPITLLPTPFPYETFVQSKSYCTDLSAVLQRASCDYDWIMNSMSTYATENSFVGELLKVYRDAYVTGSVQPISLAIRRYDFAATSSTPPSVKHTSHSCDYSSSFPATLTSLLHRHIIARCNGGEGLDMYRHLVLPANQSLVNIPASIARALRLFEEQQGLVPPLESLGTRKKDSIQWKPSCSVLCIVSQDPTVEDDRWLELLLWEQYQIQTLRCSLGGVEGRLHPTSRNLTVQGQTIGLVIFRAGFLEKDYPTRKEWEARRMIEFSSAIKCPTLGHMLLDLKWMHYMLLNRPSSLERFSTNNGPPLPRISKQVRQLALGRYAVDDRTIVNRATAHPDKYLLLKCYDENPYHYGTTEGDRTKRLVAVLKSQKLQEHKTYLLVDKLHEMTVATPGYIHGTPMLVATPMTFSMFNAFISVDENVVVNECVGHSMSGHVRTAKGDTLQILSSAFFCS